MQIRMPDSKFDIGQAVMLRNDGTTGRVNKIKIAYASFDEDDFPIYWEYTYDIGADSLPITYEDIKEAHLMTPEEAIKRAQQTIEWADRHNRLDRSKE